MYTKFSDFSLELVSLINTNGGEARFVGGCVRDALLGKQFEDIDIASTLTPNKLIEVLTAQKMRYLTHGIEHGTITVVKDGEKVEVTTLRKDINCDGRHANVQFTDNWQADAARRDFTMNAIYIDISGNIHDYFDGVNDIQSGTIRFIGNPDERITEDYLRILRLFRFHAHYGKQELSDGDIQACSRHLEGISNVSVERISHEFLKWLAAPMPIYSLVAAQKSGVLQKILPMNQYAIDELHDLLILEKNVHYLLKFACLLCHLSSPKKDIERLADYWHMSNNEKNYLIKVLASNVDVHFSMTQKQEQKAIRILGRETYIDILCLTYARNSVGNAARFKEMNSFAKNWTIPKLPVKGVDLLKLGIKEGQEIGQILKAAEAYWESQDYNATQEQILAHLNIKTLIEETI